VSLRIRALPDRTPEPVRRWVLRALFRATVGALESPPAALRGLSSEELLRAYAVWTDRLCREVLADPSRRADAERRLFAAAERLGRRVRRGLGVRTRAEALEVARRLYGIVDIDLAGDDRGRIVVARCRFSTTYSAQVCAVMSATDAGLLSGLTGGARLTFTERITAGAPACVAWLVDGTAP
jgi:hypothetical protein